MKKPSLLSFCGEDFRFLCRPATAHFLEVEVKRAPVARLEPSRCDNLDEKSALVNKFRKHITDDRLSGELNVETTVPFGAECKIKRSISCFDRFALVTADFFPGGDARRIELDPAHFPGPWTRARFKVFGQNEQEMSLGADKQTLYSGASPILYLELEGEGRHVEIGIAGDLWRHTASGERGEFAIEGNAEGISLRRVPWVAAEGAEPDRRPKRFRYYLAWRGAEKITSSAAALPGAPEGEDVFRRNAAGETLPEVCWKSAGGRRHLRNIVRRTKGSLCLALGEPGVCFDAAHLERPNKVLLQHTDMDDYLEFYCWANRHLAKDGAALTLAPAAPRTALINLSLAPRQIE